MAIITFNNINTFFIQYENSVSIYSFPLGIRLAEKFKYFVNIFNIDFLKQEYLIEDDKFQVLQDHLGEAGIVPINYFLLDGEYKFDGEFGYYVPCSFPNYKAINFGLKPMEGSITDIEYDYFDVAAGGLKSFVIYGTFNKNTNIFSIFNSNKSFNIINFDDVISIKDLK